ncbi:alpha/beta hydrolase [Kitasatospora sp. NPDC088351]|uniref:alpha/beta hydrolase n=1 Tax=Kitasatospora sp. NPDC088351 TaxID=3155180 RepID=UPI00341F23F7
MPQLTHRTRPFRPRAATAAAATAAALLLAPTCAPPAAAATAPARTAPARTAPARTAPARTALAWGACPAPTPNANGTVTPRDPRQQCASLRVPRDYRHPEAGSITLEISRIRTATPAHRHGDLLVVPGGPGGSGLDHPSRMATQLPPAVLDHDDLIGLDERGIGNSAPVACGLPPADRSAALAYPFPAPDGTITANLAHAHRVADSCAARTGGYLADITTANSARDLDRVRAALGDPRISYLGTSYGTYLGEVYATLFPARTDRVVLDSVVAPGGERQALGLLGQGAEDAFPDLAAWLAAHDSTLHLGADPAAVRATYDRLTARLDTTPLVLGDGRVLTGNALRTVTYATLVSPAYYPTAAAVWQRAATTPPTTPAAYYPTAAAVWQRAATTPPTTPAAYYPTAAAVWQRAAATPPAAPAATPPTTPAAAMSAAADGPAGPLPGVVPDNFIAAQDAVLCGDTPWPRDSAYYAARTAADRIRHPLTNGMPGNVWPCAFWHYRPAEPPVRITGAGPRNILLLQDLRDPDTPLTGARRTRRALGHRAALLTVDAAGHGVDFADPRVRDPLTAFLLTGRLPG